MSGTSRDNPRLITVILLGRVPRRAREAQNPSADRPLQPLARPSVNGCYGLLCRHRPRLGQTAVFLRLGRRQETAKPPFGFQVLLEGAAQTSLITGAPSAPAPRIKHDFSRSLLPAGRRVVPSWPLHSRKVAGSASAPAS